MKQSKELLQELKRINGRGYPAYRDVKGKWAFKNYVLDIIHVQSDPFASPSDVAVEITQPGYPQEYYASEEARISLQDMILRFFNRGLREIHSPGSKKSGSMKASRPIQKVLERSAVSIFEDGSLRVKFNVSFPAAGRKILSGELIRILFDELPDIVDKYLIYTNFTEKQKQKLLEAWHLEENQQAIRQQMKERKLSAFVANGSLLPRRSGAEDQPMENALPFHSPESLQVEFAVPYGEPVKGMGIPEGITLIVGGGYHGKSTLLAALEEGVYNHIAGDGREYVFSEPSAVKIRSEDGRAIHQQDISMFIQNLPQKISTTNFTTQDASGSTSQAANVVEAIQSGTNTLLIDEDTCATNFMVRDELMAKIVHQDEEPIIPFIRRIRQLYGEKGISTILVAGSSGAFFDQADTIIQMNEYEPVDITEKAKEAAKEYGLNKTKTELEMKTFPKRVPLKIRSMDQDRVKAKTNGMDTLLINREPVDVRYLEQLVDPEQLHTLSKMLVYAQKNLVDENRSLEEIVDILYDMQQTKGPGVFGKGALARVRKQEIAAAFNRWRQQNFRQKD